MPKRYGYRPKQVQELMVCPRCRSALLARILYRYRCTNCDFQGEKDDFDFWVDPETVELTNDP